MDTSCPENTRTLKERVLTVVAAGTYAMHRYLGLVDLCVDTFTRSACIEVGPQPRMHLNADFVARYCTTDEHLFLLVMHELRHLALGHARLFPRSDWAHNIAFDAIINADLCRELPGEEYTSFFQAVNGTQTMAERLLRPPPDWQRLRPPPGTQVMRKAIPGFYGVRRMSTLESRILHSLYFGNPNEVAIADIVGLLKESGEAACADATLLGDHATPGGGPTAAGPGNTAAGRAHYDTGDQAALTDPAHAGALREAAQEGNLLGDRVRGRGRRGGLFQTRKKVDPKREFLLALRAFLAKAGITRAKETGVYAWRKTETTREFTTAIPDWRDRHAAAREMLLPASLLFQSSRKETRRRWTHSGVAHVYLDVSGSMTRELPWIAAALAPLEKQGKCRLFMFSTVVDKVPRGGLLTGSYKNTYGTDIRCVCKHLLAMSPGKTPQKAVILTDGYTGPISQSTRKKLSQRRVDLYVGLTGPYASGSALEASAKLVEQLPDPVTR